jgi:hypothetical protein
MSYNLLLRRALESSYSYFLSLLEFAGIFTEENYKRRCHEHTVKSIHLLISNSACEGPFKNWIQQVHLTKMFENRCSFGTYFSEIYRKGQHIMKRRLKDTSSDV